MTLILYFTQINISIRNIFISPFAQKYTYAHCVDKYAKKQPAKICTIYPLNVRKLLNKGKEQRLL